MNIDDDLGCICGKTFGRANAAANHRKACPKARARVLNNLKRLREVVGERQLQKKQKLMHSLPVQVEQSCKPTEVRIAESSANSVSASSNVSENKSGPSNYSIAERRTPRSKKAPAWHQDYVNHADIYTPSRGQGSGLPAPLPKPRSPSQSPSQDANAKPFIEGGNVTSDLDQSSADPRKELDVTTSIRHTELDQYRIWRAYPGPSNTFNGPPDASASASGSSLEVADNASHSTTQKTEADVHPYPNLSSFLLGEWYWNGSMQKSKKDFSDLLCILKSSAFLIDDIQRTSWSKVDLELGKLYDAKLSDCPAGGATATLNSAWLTKEISIQVPFHHRLGPDVTPGPRTFVAGDLRYRSITSLLREKLPRVDPEQFEISPHMKYWSPYEGAPSQRIYDELFTSDAFLEAQRALEGTIPEPGCNLPRVIVGLMFSSDETHLTQFGETKLWPLYMYFGNESKYERSRPSSNLCEHIAYLTKLPDSFRDFLLKNLGNRRQRSSMISHCVREVLHAQWKEILDKEFIEAYKHGIVILCLDGILRRFFPRIFTYSADYKEKIILAGIRSLALCPCPRCLVPLKEVPNTGTPMDRAWRVLKRRKDGPEYRNLILAARTNLYTHNFALDGEYVDGLLKEESLVPTENAFSDRLSSLGFDFYRMFAVDLMHEIESGNWKALFIHLLRIFRACESPTIPHEVDKRYRQIPTFGRDTIRRFRKNVTEMRNLAARDWEDMLQCAIPVVDSLLPEEDDSVVLDLLFLLAYWHGMAKLRLHTDETLDILDDLTTRLGNQYRKFKDTTCKSYNTQELPREADARVRRAQAAAKGSTTGGGGSVDHNESAKAPTKRLRKEFNMATYKFHAFGDYVATIKWFGTTDSYSTESGELEHRASKTRYKRTSKKNYIVQMSQIERRQDRIRHIRANINKSSQWRAREDAPAAIPGYEIGKSEKKPLYLAEFLYKHAEDPATQGFLPRLKEHLLLRARHPLNQGEQGRNKASPTSISFHQDRIYSHQTMRLRYVGYDVKIGQDVIRSGGANCNIMLVGDAAHSSGPDSPKNACNESHPFVYARVLGIFHANVIGIDAQVDSSPQRMEFLWVRWYRHHTPAQAYRLDRLTFYPLQDKVAFGFVDPANVIRACHVLPVFPSGARHDGSLEVPSDTFWHPKQLHKLKSHPLHRESRDGFPRGVSKLAQDRTDWNEYYVNPFVDRDMLMRYHWGMAVGHTYCRAMPDISYRFNSVSPNDNPSSEPGEVATVTVLEDPGDQSTSQGEESNGEMVPIDEGIKKHGGYYDLELEEDDLVEPEEGLCGSDSDGTESDLDSADSSSEGSNSIDSE